MAPSRRCYTTYTPRLAAPAGLCSFTALYTLHTIQLHNAVQHTTYATPLTSRLTSHLTARLISHQGSSTSELPPDVVEELDLPGLLDTIRTPRPAEPPPAGSYHAALRLQSNHIGSVEPGAFVCHTGLEPRTSGRRARPQPTCHNAPDSSATHTSEPRLGQSSGPRARRTWTSSRKTTPSGWASPRACWSSTASHCSATARCVVSSKSTN